MKITIDRKIYNDEVISKVVYWLSGEHRVIRTYMDEFIDQIDIAITPGEETEAMVEERVYRLLNDFKLRQIVADETRDIKTILYAKAFAEDEELSEEDIHD